MKNKVLLLKIENESVYNPLGLLYVGSYLKNNGYEVGLEIIPSTLFLNAADIQKKAKTIAENDYLFVGFSVLSGPQTKYSAILSKEIKKINSKTCVVWGGIHPSLLPRETLSEDYVDMIVIGEGERIALGLADALSRGKDLGSVKGIGYKKEKELIFSSEQEMIKDMDDISIDWSLVDMQRCLLDIPGTGEKGFIYLTSRGCPHDCSFCYNRIFNKRKWRVHSIERVVKDIEELKKDCGINTISFMDDHFFVNRSRSFEILSRLKAIGISCSEFLLRVDEITEESVKRLDDLGVKRIFIGIESGNDRILSLMDKNTTRKMILEKFSILSKYKNIAVTSAMIIGYPTETLKEIKDSISLGLKLSKMIPGIVVTYQTFLPYPGTDAYELAIREGFKPPLSTEGYDIYDSFGNSMPLSWLPWADEKTRILFYRIDKYGKLLTHSKSSSLIRSIGKKVFYYLAKFRLKNMFFLFPFEIAILFKFNRYYNPGSKI